MSSSLRVTLRLFLLSVLLWLLHSLAAQEAPLRYEMDLTLDDRLHRLSGEIQLHYTNRSADSLPELVFHLWPNAFSSRHSDYARQQLQLGRAEFHFARAEQRGGFDSLSFLLQDRPLAWKPFENQPDLAHILLPEPLPPGDSIILRIPFQLHIPELFGHFGHRGHYYQMTHWYPCPALYDSSGWNTMPYLEIGDVQQEFADYQLRLTLPANYLVAASGELQSDPERIFLQEKQTETERLLQTGFPVNPPTPPSADSLKTILFSASGVPGFAWCAAKDFHLLERQTGPDSLRCQVFFSNQNIKLWRRAPLLLNDAIAHFQKILGPYPFSHITAVESFKPGSFGLDFPMLAVIGEVDSEAELDGFLAHELLQQWFSVRAGIDQRHHSWLSEGLCSYYEDRYLANRYGSEKSQPANSPFPLLTNISLDELAYLYMARRDLDTAPADSAAPASGIHHYINAYAKPTIGFHLLEEYIGQVKFDSAVHLFLRKRPYRHPGPTELQEALESISGKDLNWFFEGLMGSTQKVDYRISRTRRQYGQYRLEVRNRGELALPYQLVGMQDGRIIFSEWQEGSAKKQEILLPQNDYDRLVIDPLNRLPDLYRKNNYYRPHALFPRLHYPKLHFLYGAGRDDKNDLFWVPLIGWNNYDKAMAGLLLYNRTLVPGRLEWAAAPLLGGFFDRIVPVGMGELNYHFYNPAPAVQRLSLGLGLRSFTYDHLPAQDEFLRFLRLNPSLEIELGHRPGSDVRQSLEFRLLYLRQEEARFTDGAFNGTRYQTSLIPQLRYTYRDRSLLSPFSLRIQVEQQDIRYEGVPGDYIKVSLEVKKEWMYEEKKRWGLRFFGGYFTVNTFRDAPQPIRQAFTLSHQGFNDYTFEHNFPARSEQSGLLARQTTGWEGGFKNAPLTDLGRSNQGILALNLYADLPLRLPDLLPLKGYFDLGYAHNPEAAFSNNFLWSGGFYLQYARDAISIYFPLLHAAPLREAYQARSSDTPFSRITFRLDLARLHPWRVLEELEF